MTPVPPGTPAGRGEPREPWPWGTLDEMERTVLGCCLMPVGRDDQHALIGQVMGTLPKDAWRDPRHWRIARMLWTLSEPGKIVEPETIGDCLGGQVAPEYVEELAYRWADTAQFLPGRVRRLRAAYDARKAAIKERSG